MRKITQNAVNALYAYRDFSGSNTNVHADESGARMYLHGSKIAVLTADGKLSVTLAGYNTNVTRERLNGLPGVSVHTRKKQAYLNGEEWDGEWKTV